MRPLRRLYHFKSDIQLHFLLFNNYQNEMQFCYSVYVLIQSVILNNY